jgi:hypothetical protein
MLARRLRTIAIAVVREGVGMVSDIGRTGLFQRSRRAYPAALEKLLSDGIVFAWQSSAEWLSSQDYVTYITSGGSPGTECDSNR